MASRFIFALRPDTSETTPSVNRYINTSLDCSSSSSEIPKQWKRLRNFEL